MGSNDFENMIWSPLHERGSHVSTAICSCYGIVPSAIWEIFSEFHIFCNLFCESLGERNNSKI